MMADPISGLWHYRSFRNIKVPVTKLEDVLFGEADFVLSLDAAHATVGGTGDFGEGLTVAFFGNAGLGSPMQIRLRAIGTGATNADWVYDYVGYLIPRWPNGVDEVPAIVGSVIRAMPHSAGSAKAGYVGSFIAVMKV
jgi:hypothetical protein